MDDMDVSVCILYKMLGRCIKNAVCAMRRVNSPWAIPGLLMAGQQRTGMNTKGLTDSHTKSKRH